MTDEIPELTLETVTTVAADQLDENQYVELRLF